MLCCLQETTQPTALTCELLTHGGFEDGLSGYTVTPAANSQFGVSDDDAANSGNFYFYIARQSPGTLSQTLGSCSGVAPTCTLSLYLLQSSFRQVFASECV